MKFKYIFGIVLLLLSFSVSALNISTDTFNINILKNQNVSFWTGFANSDNKTIYDLQIQDINYFTFPIIEKLEINESINYTYDVYTNNTIDTSLATKILWFYKEMLETDIDTYYINITDSGFIPNKITLDGNDKLIFTNIDTVPHTISEFDDLFTFVVNSTYEFTRDDVATFIVVDETTGRIMILNITNKTEITNVHYSTKDIPLMFYLKAEYPASTLQLDLYTLEFTVDYNGYTDGVFQITALEDTFNIELALDWTIFSYNNFPLAKDQSKIITYRISPDIDKTSETNVTHNFMMNISSANAPFYENLIKVTIPYQFLGNEDEEEQKTQFVYIFDEDQCFDFCEKYPDKCPLETELKIEYILKEKNISLSEKQVQELYEGNQRLKNQFEGLKGSTDGLTKTLSDFKTALSGDISFLKNESQERTDKEEGRNVSLGILVIGIVLVVVLIYCFVLVLKTMRIRRSKKSRDEGMLP